MLETAQHSDLYGELYVDISERIYKAYLEARKEKQLRKIANIYDRVKLRFIIAKFYRWHKVLIVKAFSDQFKKMKDYITRLIRENKELQTGLARSSASTTPREKEITKKDEEKTLKLLNSQGKVPSSFSSNKQSVAALSLDITDIKEKQKDSLFDRLYLEASRKKEFYDKVRELEKDKELKDCTFQPEISTSSFQNSHSVFDRLYVPENKKQLEETSKRYKEYQELMPCTFTPTINKYPDLVSPRPSHERLYELAETKRQSLRVKEITEQENELKSCTFRPQITTPKRRRSVPNIYDELYKVHNDNLIKQRKRQLESKKQFSQEYTFQPQLVTPRRAPSAEPAHERLYKDMEKREHKQREKLIEATKERSSSVPRFTKRSPSEEPAHQRLYALHKKLEDKRTILKEKALKESGMSFKPKLYKPGKTSKLLSSRDGVDYIAAISPRLNLKLESARSPSEETSEMSKAVE